MLSRSYRLGPWSQRRIDLFRTTVGKGASADGADSRSSLAVTKVFLVVMYGHGVIIASRWLCYRRSQYHLMGWRRSYSAQEQKSGISLNRTHPHHSHYYRQERSLSYRQSQTTLNGFESWSLVKSEIRPGTRCLPHPFADCVIVLY